MGRRDRGRGRPGVPQRRENNIVETINQTVSGETPPTNPREGGDHMPVVTQRDEEGNEQPFSFPLAAPSGASSTAGMSSDQRIEAGRKVGRERAAELYGMGSPEIREGVQDVVKRRREKLEGKSPAADAMRRRRNEAMRMAKARGASEGQLEELKRGYGRDIASIGFQEEERGLSNYQKLIGNILGGTSSLEMGHAGLEKAGEQAELRYPSSSSGLGGMFGTVICTELYNQGYLSQNIITEDARYGSMVRATRPHIYTGYRILADPIVAAMKKSSVFTWFVALLGVAWARNMAGYENGLGKLVSFIGEPLCGFVGKLATKRRKKCLH